MRFRKKRLEKQTHIDHFPLKKNPKRIHLASLYLLMSQYTIKEVSNNKKNRKHLNMKNSTLSSFLLGNVIFTYSVYFIW